MKKIILISLFICFNIYAQKEESMKNILSKYSFENKMINIKGLEISYIKEGNGEKTLLFIHGLSSNLDAWSKNIEQLKKEYTCVALDLPGFGKSTIKDVKSTPSFFAEIIKDLITTLNLKNITLVGHSMGGQASLKFASKYPNQIKKLILIAPAGLEIFTEKETSLMKMFFTPEVILNTNDSQIEKNYALNFYKSPQEITSMINDRKNIKKAVDFKEHCKAIVNSIYGMLDEPVIEDLKNIKTPTLLIFGENDALIPNKIFHSTLKLEGVLKIATENIKNLNIETISESGHFVQFEKPLKVNQYIESFIKK